MTGKQKHILKVSTSVAFDQLMQPSIVNIVHYFVL